MAVKSITLSTSLDPVGVTITRDQFHEGVRGFLADVRGTQSGKVTEPGELTVPADDDFADLDWYDGGDIAGIATKLIEKHPTLFAAARASSIDYQWKRKGGDKGGKATYGMCCKAGGLLKAYESALEFVIWLAADNIRDAALTPYQIEAIIFHELKHVGRSDKGKPVLIPHDATVFLDEISEYGLWMQDIRALGATFQQLSLEED